MDDAEFLYEQVFKAHMDARPGERGTSEHGERGASINFEPVDVIQALVNVLASYIAQTQPVNPAESRPIDGLADEIRDNFKESYQHFRAHMLMAFRQGIAERDAAQSPMFYKCSICHL